MAHFLLTNLILEKNLIQDNGRIVNLSSSMARINGKMQWDDLQYSKQYAPWYAYGQSKLANVLFTIELQSRLKKAGKKITTYSVDPGSVNTDLQRHPSWFLWLIHPIRWFFSKTPLQGAQTSLYCALQPGLESEAGKFFANSAVINRVPSTFNSADAERLWTETERLIAAVSEKK